MTNSDASKHSSPLADSDPWDEVAVGYQDVSRPYLEKFSLRGLELLRRGQALTETTRLLDLACGPGTTSLLCATQVQSVDGVDFSQNMLSVFSDQLKVKNLNNVTLHHCDGQNLPFADERFECAVSMFGLMFFPDRLQGMKEVHRVLTLGGTALISSWAPVVRSSAMMAMFEGVRALDPTRPGPQADSSSLENPEVFEAELREVGFSDIEIYEVEESMNFKSPDELWDDLARGAIPLVMMKQKMGAALFEEKSQIAKARLRDVIGERRALSSIAYLAIAKKRA